MLKISVVIPTLQKNLLFLGKLLASLDKDTCVDEIIVIDNSCKGLDYKSDKLRVVIPNENLFVNPSWNLGVKEAKNEIVALLNDDIIIPDGFCSSVAEKMAAEPREKVGCIGFCADNILETKDLEQNPEKTNLTLKKVNGRSLYWGIAIFFYKNSYHQIPEELKIYCGDDWIFVQNQKCKKQNYNICGQNIYHYQSLSSGEKVLNHICKNDIKLYRKLIYKWWQWIFNFEFVYKGFRVTIFGIKFMFHYGKKH